MAGSRFLVIGCCPATTSQSVPQAKRNDSTFIGVRQQLSQRADDAVGLDG